MDVKFEDLQKHLKWFVAFRHPQDIWTKHPSFLICEVVFYIFTLLTLKHALTHGGRYKYMWLATVFHGLVVESVSYFVPDIDNFWHAESMVTLLGKRLPLHVACIYPCFLYTAGAIVARLHLKKWCEPFAMGLTVVLLDIPFDIMGIKLLWWTWHDTDPNIYERHYWVPWTSYYFHATFAASFCFLFHGTRALISGRDKFVSAGFFTELFCALLTGLFSMPCGIIQFIGIYHGLHDNFDIHTEVCVLLLLGFYGFMAWCGDRCPTAQARSDHRGWFDELGLLVLIHYALYVFLVFLEKPESIVATGVHERIGPCNETTSVHTPLGQVLSKRAHLCVTDFDEDYFDFHCLPGGKPPPEGAREYSVCGTPYENQHEYIVVVTAFCLLGYTVLMQMLACSGKQPRGVAAVPAKQAKQKRH